MIVQLFHEILCEFKTNETPFVYDCKTKNDRIVLETYDNFDN